MDRNSQYFEKFILSDSSSFFKTDIECDLKENNSSGFVNGAILGQNDQHHEIKTNIKHIGQTTKSYQKIKSVLNKNSKAVFQGKIYVDKNAQKTNFSSSMRIPTKVRGNDNYKLGFCPCLYINNHSVRSGSVAARKR